jgi:putative methanogenesis marker protein 11
LKDDPYSVPYQGIYAICDKQNEKAEIIEHSNCYSGACWSLYHYAKSPAVQSVHAYGEYMRYSVTIGKSSLQLKSSVAAAGIESVLLNADGNEVQITYMGIGGGGVGATKCRAFAQGVSRYEITESGGGKTAVGKIYVPRRGRVLVAIDDTDSCEEGATWTLAHNIAETVSNPDAIYLSQALVQLFPVPEKTQNCMSTVLEFGCTNKKSEDRLINDIKCLLLKYSVSENTGMLVYSDFTVSDELKEYSRKGRTERVSKAEAIETSKRNGVDIILDGNGIIGALAAFAWFARPLESVKPEFDVHSI